MSRSQKSSNEILFITGSVFRRIPLFSKHPQLAEIFIENIEFYRRQMKMFVHGYVVMPDHYHLVVSLGATTLTADYLRKMKSYFGRTSVDWLAIHGPDDLELFRLQQEPTKKRESSFGILQYDNVVLQCSSHSIAQTKLNYIHQNPVKAGLVTLPDNYPYSSYRAYKYQEAGAIVISQLID